MIKIVASSGLMLIKYISSINVLIKNHFNFKKLMNEDEHHAGKVLYRVKWHNNWDKIIPEIHLNKENYCATYPLVGTFLQLNSTSVEKARIIIELTKGDMLKAIHNMPIHCKGLQFLMDTLFTCEMSDRFTFFYTLRNAFVYNKHVETIGEGNSERIRVLSEGFAPYKYTNEAIAAEDVKKVINLFERVNTLLGNHNNPLKSKLFASLTAFLENLPYAIKYTNVQRNEELSDAIKRFLVKIKNGIEWFYENRKTNWDFTSYVRKVCADPSGTQGGIIKLCLLLENIPGYSCQNLLKDIFKSFYIFMLRPRKRNGLLSNPEINQINAATTNFIKRIYEEKKGAFQWIDFLSEATDELINHLSNSDSYDILSDDGELIYKGLSNIKAILHGNDRHREKPRFHVEIPASIKNGKTVEGELIDISKTGSCFLSYDKQNTSDQMRAILLSGKLNIKIMDGDELNIKIERAVDRISTTKKKRGKVTYWGISFGNEKPEAYHLQQLNKSTKMTVS